MLLVPVGCGKCIECLKQKAREWQIRLSEEIKNDNKAIFITLTFNTQSLIELKKELKGITGYELDNELATLAVRRFLERWRKKHKKSVKHWLITELGGGRYEHMHIHGIIWTEEKREEIKKIWKYGYIYTGYSMNEAVGSYCIKYMYKQDPKHKEYKPKMNLKE